MSYQVRISIDKKKSLNFATTMLSMNGINKRLGDGLQSKVFMQKVSKDE